MTDIAERLRDSLDEFMRHQFTGSGAMMTALHNLAQSADAALPEIERLRGELETAHTDNKDIWDRNAEVRAERDALKVELDICRDAIETCYLAVEAHLPTDSDSDAAVHRCTRRRLNEAVGKAAPRLMFERTEGQRFYGLRWKELLAECDALRAGMVQMRSALDAPDAERYRFLRANLTEVMHLVGGRAIGLSGLTGDELDSTIDAAMISLLKEANHEETTPSLAPDRRKFRHE